MKKLLLKLSLELCARYVLGILAITLLASIALASTPPYWMILSRTSDNHGKGVYTVDQDITFQHDGKAGVETWTVNERWFIQNEQSMRLEVTGRRGLSNLIHLTYIYQNNKRYFVDENGVKKSEKISDDFFEPYFHYRLSKNLKTMLVGQNIAPPVSIKSEPTRYNEKTPRAEPESYIRLSRTGGVIAYAIGIPTPVSSADNYPGLWIEQDQFHVRKLRLASQLEVSATNYKEFSKDLWLPKLRSVNWANQNVKIQLNSAVPSKMTTTLKEALDASSLNFGKNPELARLIPEDNILKAFYSRMR